MEFIEESTNSEVVQSAQEKNEITKLAILLFDHLEEQIKSADSKAVLTLSANGILVTLFTDLSKELLTDLGKGFTLTFTFLIFSSIFGSILYSLIVVMPTLTASAGQNLFYFGNIQKLREEEFINKFQEQKTDEICASLLAQVYIKAKIANRKFNFLTKSLYFFFVALGVWALSQLLDTFNF